MKKYVATSATRILLGLVLGVFATAPPLLAQTTQELTEQGDAAWERRAQGASGARAEPGPVEEAIGAYERALEKKPSNLEARWKLLRALYFLGEYAISDDDAEVQRAVYERGRDLGEEGLKQLTRRVPGASDADDLRHMEPAKLRRHLDDVPAAGRLFFWTAIHWGLYGENIGRLTAARQGVGDHIRDYAEAAIALDETYEDAGGHRLLGRLHAVAPKIIFFTGWVDRDKALEHLRRAWELAPDEPYNGLYLAEAILEHEPDDRARALSILRELAARSPRESHAVEDAYVLDQVRDLLDEETS